MSKSSLNNCGEVLEIDYTMPEDDYVQALTVNESTSQTVWFDDIELTQEESLITQETQYDPFGLELAGIGKDGNPEFDWKYNSKELIDDLDLNWSDYGARYYDPQLGRWTAVDELAEMYDEATPYNYVLNDPTNAIDPDGMACEGCGENGGDIVPDFKKDYRYIADFIYKDNNGNEIGRIKTDDPYDVIYNGSTRNADGSISSTGSTEIKENTVNVNSTENTETTSSISIPIVIGSSLTIGEIAVGAVAVGTIYAIANPNPMMGGVSPGLDGSSYFVNQYRTPIVDEDGKVKFVYRPQQVVYSKKRTNRPSDEFAHLSNEEIANELAQLSKGHLTKQQKARKMKLNEEQKVRGTK